MFKSFLLSSLVLGLAVQNCASTPKGKKNIAEASSSAAADESVEVSDEEKFRNAFTAANESLKPALQADPEVAKSAKILGVPTETLVAIIAANLAVVVAGQIVPRYVAASKLVEAEFNSKIPGLMAKFKTPAVIEAAQKVAETKIAKDADGYFARLEKAIKNQKDDDILKIIAEMDVKYSTDSVKYKEVLERVTKEKESSLALYKSLDKESFIKHVGTMGIPKYQAEEIVVQFKKSSPDLFGLGAKAKGLGQTLKKTGTIIVDDLKFLGSKTDDVLKAAAKL